MYDTGSDGLTGLFELDSHAVTLTDRGRERVKDLAIKG